MLPLAIEFCNRSNNTRRYIQHPRPLVHIQNLEFAEQITDITNTMWALGKPLSLYSLLYAAVYVRWAVINRTLTGWLCQYVLLQQNDNLMKRNQPNALVALFMIPRLFSFLWNLKEPSPAISQPSFEGRCAAEKEESYFCSERRPE